MQPGVIQKAQAYFINISSGNVFSHGKQSHCMVTGEVFVFRCHTLDREKTRFETYFFRMVSMFSTVSKALLYIWSENSRPKSEAKDGGN